MVSHGYLEFNRPEAKILVDESGKPTEIKLREQRTGMVGCIEQYKFIYQYIIEWTKMIFSES